MYGSLYVSMIMVDISTAIFESRVNLYVMICQNSSTRYNSFKINTVLTYFYGTDHFDAFARRHLRNNKFLKIIKEIFTVNLVRFIFLDRIP